MTKDELMKKHKLLKDDPILDEVVKNPLMIGLTEELFNGMPPEQRRQYILGEYFFLLWKQIGEESSELLINAQLKYTTPEWFDHRHHFLFPDKWLPDFVTESANNVLRVLPKRGKLLNLCSGDGFYDYYFFRHRAEKITCVELNDQVFEQAVRLHSAANIDYIKANVLEYVPEESYFDAVVIRGAIEHFSREDQQKILKKAHKALKNGGWFCGDTPEKDKVTQAKHLSFHDFEWSNEEEMRSVLGTTFSHIESLAYDSDNIPPLKQITTLFWRCRK